IVLHLNDGAFGIDDVEVEHGVDFHRDIVARDHVLGRYLDDLDAQIDAHHFLHEGNQQHQSGALDLLKAPQSEDYGSLILAQDLYRRHDQSEGHDEQDNRDDIERQDGHGAAPFRLGAAHSQSQRLAS